MATSSDPLLYPVNEIFFSIQGEGLFAGRQALFIRLSGCNRSCSFCDTRDETNLLLSPARLADLAVDIYPSTEPCRDRKEKDLAGSLVIITGGEPLIRDLRPLLLTLRDAGFTRIHVETNGDRLPPAGPGDDFPWELFSFLSIAPKWRYDGKRGDPLDQALDGSLYIRNIPVPFEIKLLVDQKHAEEPGLLAATVELAETAYPGASRYWLIPIDPGGRGDYPKRIRKILDPLLRNSWRHPRWSVGLQLHKIWRIR